MSAQVKAPTPDDASTSRSVSVAGLEPKLHRTLEEWARAALRTLGAEGEVRVRVIDDPAMADAHVRYSGVAGTTDVLTFDLSGDPEGPLDVDILVCIDEARRQAETRGHAVDRELLLYIIHGILHCLGHDDHDDARATLMHAEEDRLLTAIGVGPTFATRGGVGGGGGGVAT